MIHFFLNRPLNFLAKVLPEKLYQILLETLRNENEQRIS